MRKKRNKHKQKQQITKNLDKRPRSTHNSPKSQPCQDRAGDPGGTNQNLYLSCGRTCFCIENQINDCVKFRKILKKQINSKRVIIHTH